MWHFEFYEISESNTNYDILLQIKQSGTVSWGGEGVPLASNMSRYVCYMLAAAA